MSVTGGDEQPQRAGFVELLFDVVLVVGFIQLDQRLIQDLSWAGFHRIVVLFLAVWWLWYRMAWTANRYDPARPAIQLMVIVTMFGVLVMAASVPKAYGEHAALFVGAYVAVQVLRHCWLVLLPGNRNAQLVSVRIAIWAAVSAVPWIAGIIAHDEARLVWWSIAVVIDYTAGILDYPTPRLGRAGLGRLPVAAEHLIERNRQLLIIALGDRILISGTQVSQYGFTTDRTVALVLSFTLTVLLWQIYFYRAGTVLPAALAATRVPVRVGQLASHSHLLMVAGVGVSAAGTKLLISEPIGRADLASVLVTIGGPALFLIGRGVLDYAAFSHVSWSRPIGLLLLAALAPVTLDLPLLLVATVVTGLVAAIAVSNVLAWRFFPRTTTPPRPHP